MPRPRPQATACRARASGLGEPSSRPIDKPVSKRQIRAMHGDAISPEELRSHAEGGSMNISPQAAAFPGVASAHSKPWLASYPPKVPAVIDEAHIGTLAEIFRRSVEAYSERAAVESFGTRMSYAELGQSADAVASWLQHQCLEKGDRVAVMLPNVMAYPAIIFGILSAGYTV